jgi:hypothetical protein
MFVGGISGVASTFYIMVEEGDMTTNLLMLIGTLLVSLLIIMLLRDYNKKILKMASSDGE